MTRMSPEEEVKYVLEEYGLTPYYLQKFNKITKAYVQDFALAVKVTTIPGGKNHVDTLNELLQIGYPRLIPLLQTRQGSLAVIFNEKFFYVMPWLDSSNQLSLKYSEEKLRELARLHSLTAQEIELSKESRESFFQETKSEWSNSILLLNDFIQDCENTSYMSPLQLQFCQYYSEIRAAINYAEKQLQDWFDRTGDSETIRIARNHGAVTKDHFIGPDSDKAYFINFEASLQTLPQHDLLLYLHSKLSKPSPNRDQLVHLINLYLTYFPFDEGELALFLSYLAIPQEIISLVSFYNLDPSLISEYEFTVKLQDAYLKMKNSEYLVLKIVELLNKSKEEDQAGLV